MDIKFIEKTIEEHPLNSTVTIAKPVPKRVARSHSTSEASSSKQPNNNIQNRSKPIDIDLSKRFDDGMNLSYKNNTPNRKNGAKGSLLTYQNLLGVKQFTVGGKQCNKKDEECFGSSVDRGKGDFDFEKNLALFDKQALWDELNSQKPDTVKQVENRKTYR